MEVCHKHAIGRTEAEFDLLKNGELFIKLEYIHPSPFGLGQEAGITLTKEEVAELDELINP